MEKLSSGKKRKLKEAMPGYRTVSGDSDKDAMGTHKGKQQKKQRARKRKEETELERSGLQRSCQLATGTSFRITALA